MNKKKYEFLNPDKMYPNKKIVPLPGDEPTQNQKIVYIPYPVYVPFYPIPPFSLYTYPWLTQTWC
jgi:hypothetical protein